MVSFISPGLSPRLSVVFMVVVLEDGPLDANNVCDASILRHKNLETERTIWMSHEK